MGSAPSKLMQNLDFTTQAPSAEERQWIEKSWQNAQHAFDKGGKKFGDQLFHTMLTRGKKIRILFKFDNMTEDKLKKEPRFIQHADLLEDTINKLVYMPADTKMLKEAERVGLAHFKRNLSGFNPMYWNIFPIIMLEIMEPYCDLPGVDSERVQGAWQKLCQFIIDIMQVAYTRSCQKTDGVNKKFVAATKSTARVRSETK